MQVRVVFTDARRPLEISGPDLVVIISVEFVEILARETRYRWTIPTRMVVAVEERPDPPVEENG